MTNHTEHYKPQFKSWRVDTHGPRPSEQQLEHAHHLGCKPGKQALAVAMGLRDCGVTNPQVLYACGNPQNNKRAGLVTDSYLKRERMPRTAEGHEIYKYTVTPKGMKRIETNKAREVALNEAGKAADAAKPAKAGKVAAKAKKASTPRVKAAKGKAAAEQAARDAAKAEGEAIVAAVIAEQVGLAEGANVTPIE